NVDLLSALASSRPWQPPLAGKDRSGGHRARRSPRARLRRRLLAVARRGTRGRVRARARAGGHRPRDPVSVTNGDCIFCKIVRGELPAAVVNRTDGFIAIEDIAPKADVHLLVLPQRPP